MNAESSFIPSHAARIESFAARFSSEDWGFLCSRPEFDQAVADLEFGVAEAIARRLLDGPLSPPAGLSTPRADMAAAEASIREFVSRWAAATGRVGRRWKQSRQNHIRRLLPRGLNSEYAAKMRAEAGIE